MPRDQRAVKPRRERSYSPPFGAKSQTVEEFDRIHDRWAADLQRELPRGVPADPTLTKQRWPQTWGPIVDGKAQHVGEVEQAYCLQCGGCAYFIELTSRLGMDWGACSNPRSQYDRQVVFEHWTCAAFSLG